MTDLIAPLPESHMLLEVFEETPEQVAAADIVDVEAQAAFVEADREFQDVQLEVAETQHLGLVADQLEKVIEIADGIEEATPNEVALVGAALEMALIGTGLTREDVMPGLENRTGLTISTESAGSVVSAIWTKIIEALKRFMEKAKIYLTKVGGELAFLMRRATRIAGRAKAMSGTSVNKPEISLGHDSRVLQIGGKAPMTYSDVEAALRETGRQYDVLMKTYPAMITDAGSDVTRALEALAADDAAKAIREMEAARKAFDLNKLASAFGNVVAFTDTRFESGSTRLVKGMPGGWGFVLVNMTKDGGGLQWVRVSDEDPEDADTMTTIPAQQCLMLAERTYEMLKPLNDLKFGGFFKNMDALFNKLEGLGKRAMGEGNGGEAATARKEIESFLRNFGQRTISPINQFIGHEIVVARSALNVCERSLAAHSDARPV